MRNKYKYAVEEPVGLWVRKTRSVLYFVNARASGLHRSFMATIRKFWCPVLFISSLCIRLAYSWSFSYFLPSFDCSPKLFPLFEMHCGCSEYFHLRCTLFYYLSSLFFRRFYLPSSSMHFYVSGLNSDFFFLFFLSLHFVSLFSNRSSVAFFLFTHFKHSIGVACVSVGFFFFIFSLLHSSEVRFQFSLTWRT